MLQSCIEYVLRLHQLMTQAACAYTEIWFIVFFLIIRTDPSLRYLTTVCICRDTENAPDTPVPGRLPARVTVAEDV